MTVFVVHPVREDISLARRFGEFRFVTQGYIYGDKLEYHILSDGNMLPRSITKVLSEAALQFNPELDCLLIIGDHLQLLAFTGMLFQLHDEIEVLRYDRKVEDYIPVRLMGLVGQGTDVLKSRTDIGDSDHGEDRRESEDCPAG